MTFSNCLVVGAGYVGIPLAAALATGGIGGRTRTVTLVDIDQDRVNQVRTGLQIGDDPLAEPGLGDLLQGASRLRAEHLAPDDRTEFLEHVRRHEVVFVCVGTPLLGSALDMRAVEQVARWTLEASEIDGTHRTVVVRSTSEPDVIRELADAFDASEHATLVVAPEFLREGRAVEDTMFADRIVVGSRDAIAMDAIARLIAPLNEHVVHRLLPEEAAAVKLATNTVLAVRVATSALFARYVATLPGGSYDRFLDALAADPRMSKAHRMPGLGAGGPCLPKDSAVGDRLFFDGAARALLGEGNAIGTRFVLGTINGLEPQRTLFAGVGFKPTSPDYRHSEIPWLSQMVPGDVHIWDPRLTRLEVADLQAQVTDLVTVSHLAPTGHWDCVVLGLPLPLAEPILEQAQSGSILVDPYALVPPGRVIRLEERGIRYFGAGRHPSFLESLGRLTASQGGQETNPWPTPSSS